MTSDTGDYVFTLLPIGTYTVKIDLQGFQTQTSSVVLTSGDRTRVDGKLGVGTVSTKPCKSRLRPRCSRPMPRR